MTKIIIHAGLHALLICITLDSFSQKKKADVKDVVASAIMKSLDEKYAWYKEKALKIWEYAEPGFHETRSTALLQTTLQENEFTVQNNVAEMPTAFVATYGSGQPVIGLLAEFDALPGLSQKPVPVKEKDTLRQNGHGCGHHLFGVGSVAAAIELKEYLKNHKQSGTIKVYGTPAEEGGSGKVFMAREGLFEGTDIVMHWHPDNKNHANPYTSLANISVKFRFAGIAAHASRYPEKGRSALDAVEAMDFMANMMREHIPSDARMHYVITNGGSAPNVVPDFAEVYYYMRHNNREVLAGLFDRLVKIAEGAAIGTGTNMSYEITGAVYDLLPNDVLSRIMYNNLVKVGGVKYTPEEVLFAQKLQQSLFDSVKPDISGVYVIQPYKNTSEKTYSGGDASSGGSTDVGDVSWVVPTVGLRAAAWPAGISSHSWQSTACGGTDIGIKGMFIAAKTLALTGIDLLSHPDWVDNAKKEWQKARGENFKYVPLIGNRKPALNYRD